MSRKPNSTWKFGSTRRIQDDRRTLADGGSLAVETRGTQQENKRKTIRIRKA